MAFLESTSLSSSARRTCVAPFAFASVGGLKIWKTGWARCGTLGRDSSGEKPGGSSIVGRVLLSMRPAWRLAGLGILASIRQGMSVVVCEAMTQ